MAQGEDNEGAAGGSRRGFLTIGFSAVSVGLAGAALGPAAAMLAYPLGNATTSGADEFVPVGGRTGFGEDPVKVDIYADRVDAWNRVVQVKVGSAWVLAQGDELVAFSAVCPHLGCGIDDLPGERKFGSSEESVGDLRWATSTGTPSVREVCPRNDRGLPAWLRRSADHRRVL